MDYSIVKYNQFFEGIPCLRRLNVEEIENMQHFHQGNTTRKLVICKIICNGISTAKVDLQRFCNRMFSWQFTFLQIHLRRFRFPCRFAKKMFSLAKSVANLQLRFPCNFSMQVCKGNSYPCKIHYKFATIFFMQFSLVNLQEKYLSLQNLFQFYNCNSYTNFLAEL